MRGGYFGEQCFLNWKLDGGAQVGQHEYTNPPGQRRLGFLVNNVTKK